MDTEKLQRLTIQLKKIYASLQEINVESLRSGWKNLTIKEMVQNNDVVTNARHINDGFLRMLAILALLEAKSDQDKEYEGILLYEIENGVNPEIIQFLVETLANAKQQIIVSTHSSLILNYLTDDQARQSVIYIYKNLNGATKAIPFFAIPSLRDRLEVLGPGEAFADRKLTELNKEIEQMNQSKGA